MLAWILLTGVSTGGCYASSSSTHRLSANLKNKFDPLNLHSIEARESNTRFFHLPISLELTAFTKKKKKNYCIWIGMEGVAIFGSKLKCEFYFYVKNFRGVHRHLDFNLSSFHCGHGNQARSVLFNFHLTRWFQFKTLLSNCNCLFWLIFLPTTELPMELTRLWIFGGCTRDFFSATTLNLWDHGLGAHGLGIYYVVGTTKTKPNIWSISQSKLENKFMGVPDFNYLDNWFVYFTFFFFCGFFVRCYNFMLEQAILRSSNFHSNVFIIFTMV